MLRRPQPEASSKPGSPMSVAERRINSKSCVLSRFGRTVHTHAAAPATSGDAKLVPEALRM